MSASDTCISTGHGGAGLQTYSGCCCESGRKLMLCLDFVLPFNENVGIEVMPLVQCFWP